MLKIIFGHSKSGKSSEIYNRIRADAENNIRSYLIVPEQQTVQCEQKLLELLPPSAQLTAEVLNFSRLADLVFRHYGGLSYNYADKGCKTLIMWKNLRELAPLLLEYGSAAEGKRCIAFSSEMLSAVAELKAYRISPEKLEAAADKLPSGDTVLKNKLLDLSLISAAYSNSLSQSFSDSADDLTKLAEKLERHDFFRGANVYLDSFTSFTAQEYEVIRQILKSAGNVTLALTADSVSTKQIHYESTANTALTLRSIARALSIEYEAITADSADDPHDSLSVIRRGLWQPDIKNVTDTDASEKISIIRANDPYEEAEAAANIIRRLMMDGVRCRDISVVARDASLYRGIIDTAFEKAEIPYFFSQQTDVLSKPVIKFLLSALRIKIFNWRASDIMTFLKTGLSEISINDVDLLECYCTVWKLNGAVRFSEEFTMNPDGYTGRLTERGKDSLKRLNTVRETLVEILSPLFTRLSSARSASDMCRALYLFMEDNSIGEKLTARAQSEYSAGRRREAAELLQLYNATVKSLENIAVSLGDEECSLSEFNDALKLILESTSVNTIPTAKDQVTVGSASMLRADGIKCAVIIGLNEGEFPQNVKENGLFSDNDKKALERLGLSLSSDTSARSSEELFFVYRALTLPTERLFMLSHEYDMSGAACTDSTVLARVKALFPELKQIKYDSLPITERILSPELAIEKLSSDASGIYGAAFRRFSENNEELLHRVSLADIPLTNRSCSLTPDTSLSPLHLTQTLIDSYVGCPFEYMCRQLLSLNDISPAGFDYSNFGTYIHYVFEHYLKRASEDGFIGLPPDPKYISRIINECADEYLLMAFSGGEANTERLRHRFSRMKRLAELVATSITKEFADSSFRPEFFELSIGRASSGISLAPLMIPTSIGKSISLSGKIDRVDLWRNGENGSATVRVIDYKSGKKKFSLDAVEKGENLQLPLYLFSICDKEQSAFPRIADIKGEIIPGGAMYLSSLISAVDVSESINVLQKAESTISRSGFLINDPDTLRAMSHSLSPDYLCKAKMGKDGLPMGKELISFEGMSALRQRLTSAVTAIGEDIISGKMNCAPSFSDNVCRCERCSMRAVCRSAALFMKK